MMLCYLSKHYFPYFIAHTWSSILFAFVTFTFACCSPLVPDSHRQHHSCWWDSFQSSPPNNPHLFCLQGYLLPTTILVYTADATLSQATWTLAFPVFPQVSTGIFASRWACSHFLGHFAILSQQRGSCRGLCCILLHPHL